MTNKQKQCLLVYLGYDTGGVDGIWGQKSISATERFQAEYGIGNDGIFGPGTESRILEVVSSGEKPTAQEPSTAPESGTFWDDIKWFREDEFKCKCGGKYCNGYPDRMKEAVVRIADAAREHFGKPAHVVSGLRCKRWNAEQGGVSNSQHMYGEAIDLRIDGVDAGTLQNFVSQQPGHRYSYKINSTNVHFDINPVGR